MVIQQQCPTLFIKFSGYPLLQWWCVDHKSTSSKIQLAKIIFKNDAVFLGHVLREPLPPPQLRGFAQGEADNKRTPKVPTNRLTSSGRESRNLARNKILTPFHTISYSNKWVNLFLWTACLCPPKIICWSLNTFCDYLRRWAHWEVVRVGWSHENRVPMRRSVSL